MRLPKLAPQCYEHFPPEAQHFFIDQMKQTNLFVKQNRIEIAFGKQRLQKHETLLKNPLMAVDARQHSRNTIKETKGYLAELDARIGRLKAKWLKLNDFFHAWKNRNMPKFYRLVMEFLDHSSIIGPILDTRLSIIKTAYVRVEAWIFMNDIAKQYPLPRFVSWYSYEHGANNQVIFRTTVAPVSTTIRIPGTVPVVNTPTNVPIGSVNLSGRSYTNAQGIHGLQDVRDYLSIGGYRR